MHGKGLHQGSAVIDRASSGRIRKQDELHDANNSSGFNHEHQADTNNNAVVRSANKNFIFANRFVADKSSAGGIGRQNKVDGSSGGIGRRDEAHDTSTNNASNDLSHEYPYQANTNNKNFIATNRFGIDRSSAGGITRQRQNKVHVNSIKSGNPNDEHQPGRSNSASAGTCNKAQQSVQQQVDQLLDFQIQEPSSIISNDSSPDDNDKARNSFKVSTETSKFPGTKLTLSSLPSLPVPTPSTVSTSASASASETAPSNSSEATSTDSAPKPFASGSMPVTTTTTTTTTATTTTAASVPSSPRNTDLSARRSRLLTSRNTCPATTSDTHRPSSAIKNDTLNSPGNNSTATDTSQRGGENPKSNARRERILAKVRANTSYKSRKEGGSAGGGNGGGNGSEGNKARDSSSALAAKIKVTSPHGEEVEMLFADEGFLASRSGESNVHRRGVQSAELVAEDDDDSISKEIYDGVGAKSNDSLPSSSLARAALALKKQSQAPSAANNAAEPATGNRITPQKAKSHANGQLSQQQQLHMASTPKIRGNCQHRRDNFEDGEQQQSFDGEEQNASQSQGVVEDESCGTPVAEKPRPRRGSDANSNSSNLHYHPSPQSQPQHLPHNHYPEDEKPHSIAHAYPLNERAPSTVSAISGISIPSCFPQDSPFGHLQQPLLGGGNFHGGGGGYVASSAAIIESTSFASANSNSLPGINVGGLGSSPRGGIGHLGMGASAFSSGAENENRRLREQIVALQKKLEEKDAIISQLMKRIGDLESGSGRAEDPSNGNGGRSFSVEWDRRPRAHRSPSTDAESVSMGSPSPRRRQQQPNAAKQSPVTTHTASTASVTTANSGKSQRGSGDSRSLPGQGQQSPAGPLGKTRRSPYRNSNGGDDRKFQC